MARYWLYLNDAVVGPYEVEHLIRQRGFSRQTLVCVDDASGKPTHWISPAQIPELAHIFKAADEQQTLMPAAAPAKIQLRPVVQRVVPAAAGPAVVLKAPPARKFSAWLYWLPGALAAGAIAFFWLQHSQRSAQAQEQETAKALVDNARLPASSVYATLNQYIHDKALQPRWEFERAQEGVWRVTLSWFSREGSSVYAFEANSQAQTVRGINTAAIRLLSEGFAAPSSSRPKPAPVKKISPSDLFAGTLDSYRQAIEGGDFPAVWSSFSQRKKMEMARGGMSRDGFIRLQTITFKVDSAPKQMILKTKDETGTQRLVLLKQSQVGRPDIFVKQVWIFENEAWKLDDEEKRSAAATAAPSGPAAPAGKPPPTSLPGMSN